MRSVIVILYFHHQEPVARALSSVVVNADRYILRRSKVKGLPVLLAFGKFTGKSENAYSSKLWNAGKAVKIIV